MDEEEEREGEKNCFAFMGKRQIERNELSILGCFEVEHGGDVMGEVEEKQLPEKWERGKDIEL